jgi:hypothetical protein
LESRRACGPLREEHWIPTVDFTPFLFYFMAMCPGKDNIGSASAPKAPAPGRPGYPRVDSPEFSESLDELLNRLRGYEAWDVRRIEILSFCREHMYPLEDEIRLCDDRIAVLDRAIQFLKFQRGASPASSDGTVELGEKTESLLGQVADPVVRERLRAVIVALMAENREQAVRLAEPKANSTNSGVSSSQDPNRHTHGDGRADPAAGGGAGDGDGDAGRGRNPGKQPGTKGCFRKNFPLGDCTVITYDNNGVEKSPCCGAEMVRVPEEDTQTDHYMMPRTPVQQIAELNQAFMCTKCRRIHRFGKPRGGFRGSILDIETLSQCLYMSYEFNASERSLQEWLLKSHGIKVSLGYLDKIMKRAALVMRPACPGNSRQHQGQAVRLLRRHPPHCRAEPQQRLGLRGG